MFILQIFSIQGKAPILYQGIKESWVKVNGIYTVVLNGNGEHRGGNLIPSNKMEVKDNTMITNE
jgi:hypothetical protein